MSARSLCQWMGLTLAIIWLPAVASAQPACQQLTATGNPEYPPYLWRDPHDPRHLIGANADLLRHAADELGLVVDVVYAGPWSRAQEEVASGRIDMMAGYFRTQAREQLMDFISPPFLFNSSVVWVREGEALRYSDWADLQGLRGGTLVNNSHGEAFDDYARQHLNLEAVPTATQAFENYCSNAMTTWFSSATPAWRWPASWARRSCCRWWNRRYRAKACTWRCRASRRATKRRCVKSSRARCRSWRAGRCLNNCWRKTLSAGSASIRRGVERASLAFALGHHHLAGFR